MFVILILCCIIAPTVFVGAFLLGANQNGTYNDGFKVGNSTGFQQGFAMGNVGSNTRSYDAGYQAGLTTQNQTIP